MRQKASASANEVFKEVKLTHSLDYTRQILQSSDDPILVFRRLLEIKRDHTKKPQSLTSVCRKAGISSKGHLSDLMTKRRRLLVKHAEGLAKALELGRTEYDYFVNLVRFANETDEERRLTVKRQLKIIAKSFGIERISEPSPLVRNPFAFEVFCAFGLFKGTPEARDLIKYFGRDRQREVHDALSQLSQGGFIARTSTGYELKSRHVVFEQGDKLAHLCFLQGALHDALNKAPTFHQSKESAHFESVILSVRRDTYSKNLPLLRDRLRELQALLESEDADMIIRFNVQIYPT